MALNPDRVPDRVGEPADYARDHLESPKQWGWHGEWGRGARLGGWIVMAILLLMTTATNYQLEYHLVLWVLAGGLFLILLRDRQRRRRSWRR